MISRFRNRSLLQYAIAILLTVLFGIVASRINRVNVNDDQLVMLILLYVGSWVMWMWGSFTLAKAKGYGSDWSGNVFIFLLALGFCFPIAPFIFPGFIIFGLKDKTRDHRRY
jgi:hypothetical protein